MSSTSSKVVAEVEYEPCADDVRLWPGVVTLRRPSEPRFIAPADIETASPVPFVRLGLFEYAKTFLKDSVDALGFFRLTLGTGAELVPVLLESGEPRRSEFGGDEVDEKRKDG